MNGLLIPFIMPHIQFLFVRTVSAIPLPSHIASPLPPLRLAKTSELSSRLRDFRSLVSSFKRTIFIIQGVPHGIAKSGARDVNLIEFYAAFSNAFHVGSNLSGTFLETVQNVIIHF